MLDSLSESAQLVFILLYTIGFQLFWSDSYYYDKTVHCDDEEGGVLIRIYFNQFASSSDSDTHCIGRNHFDCQMGSETDFEQASIKIYSIPISHFMISFMIQFILLILAHLHQETRYRILCYPDEDIMTMYLIFRIWCVIVLHTHICDISEWLYMCYYFLIRSFEVWSGTRLSCCCWCWSTPTTSTWEYDQPHFVQAVVYCTVSFYSDSTCFEYIYDALKYDKKLIGSSQ